MGPYAFNIITSFAIIYMLRTYTITMKKITNLVLTMSFLLFVTTATVLYSEGWRLGSLENNTSQKPSVVVKTGMLAVRSMPQGAKVYVNGKAVTATDDTISSLKIGKYKLKIMKEGFEIWQKEVEVFPELVTDITAVLVLRSPRLEPLTNADVKAFDLSANRNNIIFLTKNHEKPGIWILPLTGTPLNIFRNESRLFISDTPLATPSLGESIEWSPNDKEIAVRMNPTGYLLYKVSDQTKTNMIPTSTTDMESIRKEWTKQWKKDFFTKKMADISEKYSPPSWLMKAALDYKTVWSPDDEKFFYLALDTENPSVFDVVVYNAEDPLPIDEKRINFPIKVANPKLTKIYWHSDSYHLILVEKENTKTNYYTISLIRIDGTNQTTIYTGYLANDQAYSTPGGNKIIVMTSLKENSLNNLYAISIR